MAWCGMDRPLRIEIAVEPYHVTKRGGSATMWCAMTQIPANLGVAGSTPTLARFSTPVDAAKPEKRWLDGLYLDQPEEWDDPYRFFRW